MIRDSALIEELKSINETLKQTRMIVDDLSRNSHYKTMMTSVVAALSVPNSLFRL